MVSVIDTIVDTKKILDNFENHLKQQSGNYNLLKVPNSSLTENDYVRVRCDKLSMDENTSVCAASNNDVRSMENQSLEDDVIDDTEHESEHTLYEESDATDVNNRKDTSFSMSDVNMSWQSNITNTVSTHDKTNEVQTERVCSNRDETYCNSHDLKPILYEQCCDLSDVTERDQTFSSLTQSLSQSCLPQIDSDSERHSDESSSEVSCSKIGKCIKVYTHKRRRSAVDEVRSKLVNTYNLVPNPPPSTDSIDLLDEPSANDVPVTMLTSLDMESAEYILSLSAESIQSIVGGTISDQHTVIGFKELNAARDASKEQSDLTTGTDCAKPVLRRSTRLNQQESDEIASNSLPSATNSAGVEKLFKKSNSPNRTESSAKVRRKLREDRKMTDYGTIDAQSSNKRSLKNKRSNSKLIVRKNNKSSCTMTGGKEKEEPKPRAASGRLRAENTERSLTSDRVAVSSVKFDAIGGINRALWGDMSDAFDDRENENLLAYPSDTEIPFAVGLLPLRTALEKMQAMPDYQPRKTRSSVAPMKQQDIIGGVLKRRANCMTSLDVATSSKKPSGNNNESPKTTVCHIQIKTAPSQDIKSRKSRFLPDPIASLSVTNVANRQ